MSIISTRDMGFGPRHDAQVSADGALGVGPFVPSAANILSGSATAANTAAAQTLLTVPAGRTWEGTITVSLTNQATTGSLVNAQIKTAGTNVTPAAGSVLLTVQAGTVGTVTSDASNFGATGDIYVQAPAGNAVTLTLTNSTATTCTSNASANGVLL